MRVLIDSDRVQARVRELGAQISRDYEGKDLAVVGILKGSFVFMADLIRQITVPVTCDFLRCSSYGDAKVSSGQVRLDLDTTQPMTGKHVLLVEDIIDTGLTMSYLLDNFRTRKPETLKVCALLHKPDRAKVQVPIDYLGFTIPDAFVVGYGLDHAGKFRNLNHIAVVE